MEKRKFIIFGVILVVVAFYFSMYQTSYKEKSGGSAPIITFDSEVVETTVEEAEVNLLKGVSAYDNEDGDVSDSILVESISKFTTLGKSIVTYVAFDSNNHITSNKRELVYTNYESPKFTLLEPLKFVYTSSLNITEAMSAYDLIDGDISDRIKYSFANASDNLATVGKHPIVFTVSNSMGDVTTLETTVEIYTETYLEKLNTPKIYLNDYLIYVKTGESVDLNSYIKYVKIDNETLRNSDLAEKELAIEIERNDFNVKVPGTYTVTYSLDSGNGYRGQTDLVIVVEE